MPLFRIRRDALRWLLLLPIAAIALLASYALARHIAHDRPDWLFAREALTTASGDSTRT